MTDIDTPADRILRQQRHERAVESAAKTFEAAAAREDAQAAYEKARVGDVLGTLSRIVRGKAALWEPVEDRYRLRLHEGGMTGATLDLLVRPSDVPRSCWHAVADLSTFWGETVLAGKGAYEPEHALRALAANPMVSALLPVFGCEVER